MRAFLHGGLPALGLCLLPMLASGQDRNCELIQSEVARPFASPDGTRISYVVRPVFRCDDGAEIRADSAVMFQSTNYSRFFRNVFMRDGTRLLQADTANYQASLGRLDAQGRVRVNDSSDGTRITGDRLLLLRAGPRRTEDILTMEGGNPNVRFTPEPARDSLGNPLSDEIPTSVDLNARKIILTGSRLVQAKGLVHLQQDSLDAYGDSLAYDQTEGVMSLFGEARMLAPQADGDTMDLQADTIIARMPGGVMERLDAMGAGRLFGTTVQILGPVIRLFFEEETVARVVSTSAPSDSSDARPPPVLSPSLPIRGLVIDPVRPEVTAEEYEISGDSVEVLTPGGEVSSVFSSGDARAVSTAGDSLNTEDTPEIIGQDWIEGDSIRAFFEPAAPSEGVATESSAMEIKLLVATGEARSLSRFRPDSTDATAADSAALNISYVLGDEIRVFLVDGEIDDMEVDNADGLVLQAAASARIMSDSASALPDTTSSPDSTRIPPDTTHIPEGGFGVIPLPPGVGPMPQPSRSHK